MKTVNVLTLGVGSTLLLSCGAGAKKQEAKEQVPQKPNVVFLIADDIGYGDLSCYGEKTIHTPNVDRLASMGIRFTDAHTVAATSTPSRYSLFTGHDSWRRSDTGIARGDAGMIIKPNQITIADMFKKAGYITGGIGKWHLGLGEKAGTQNWNEKVSPGPEDIGFDYSFLMAATGDRVPCVWMHNQRVHCYDPSAPITVSYPKPIAGEPTGKDNPELLTKLKPSHGHDQSIVNGISRIGHMKGGGKALWMDENIADTITTKAIQFINDHKDKPFFLYVGTNDIHVPRYPHGRFVGKSGMGKRGDAILEFDWTVGEIIKTLEANGLMENTVFVLSSDNGPVIDDGYQDQAEEKLGNHRPWGDFRGGKYSNFEAGTRVPLLFCWQAKVKPGVSSALVSQVDLYASMANLLGQKIEEGAAPDSQDMLKAFMGEDTKGREYVLESASSLSVSDGEWKYITPNDKPAINKQTKTEYGNSPEDQLYNLKKDVGEKNNVAAEYPEVVARLKAIIAKEEAKEPKQIVEKKKK